MESPSQTVIEGADVEFRCNASGVPTPNIIWERLGSKLPKGAVDQNGLLAIVSVGPEDAGTYVCKAVNSEGEDSVIVQLKVIGKGETGLDTQPNSKRSLCWALLTDGQTGKDFSISCSPFPRNT